MGSPKSPRSGRNNPTLKSPLLDKKAPPEGGYSHLQGDAGVGRPEAPRGFIPWVTFHVAKLTGAAAGTPVPRRTTLPDIPMTPVAAALPVPAQPSAADIADQRLDALCRAGADRDPDALLLHTHGNRAVLDKTLKAATPQMRARVISSCCDRVQQLLGRPERWPPHGPSGISICLRVAARCLVNMSRDERAALLPKVFDTCLQAMRSGDGASFDAAWSVASYGDQAVQSRLFAAMVRGEFPRMSPDARAAHYTWIDFDAFPTLLVSHSAPADWGVGGNVPNLLVERGIALNSLGSIVEKVRQGPDSSDRLQALILAFHAWFDWKFAQQVGPDARQAWRSEMSEWLIGLSTCIQAVHHSRASEQAWAPFAEKVHRLFADDRYDAGALRLAARSVAKISLSIDPEPASDIQRFWSEEVCRERSKLLREANTPGSPVSPTSFPAAASPSSRSG